MQAFFASIALECPLIDDVQLRDTRRFVRGVHGVHGSTGSVSSNLVRFAHPIPNEMFAPKNDAGRGAGRLR